MGDYSRSAIMTGIVSKHATAVLRLAALSILIIASVVAGIRILDQVVAPEPRPAASVRGAAHTADFVVLAQQWIPPEAQFRIIGPNGRCPGSARNYLVIYELLPRMLSCDPRSRYWVYFGAPPSPNSGFPPGTRIHTFEPTMLVVELPAVVEMAPG
jgi:hypothetical protein